MKYLLGFIAIVLFLAVYDGRSKECIKATKSWESSKVAYAHASSWAKAGFADTVYERYREMKKVCR